MKCQIFQHNRKRSASPDEKRSFFSALEIQGFSDRGRAKKSVDLLSCLNRVYLLAVNKGNVNRTHSMGEIVDLRIVEIDWMVKWKRRD